jgi:hypothetical protein
VEFDTDLGILFCTLCVGDRASSPPTRPGGGGGGPAPRRPRTPDDSPNFASAPDAARRFPRFRRSSEAHADAFAARHEISGVIRQIAPRWEELFGESISVQDVDEELIAFGIGVTLWSAGLDPGEIPEPSEGNLVWLVRNPLLSMYVGELVSDV